MRAQFINEKFEEYGDPVHQMGIGVEELIKNFEKDLDEALPWINEEPLYRYFPDKKLIEIDCWPLSKGGYASIKKVVYKLVKKYKNILQIINMPVYKNIDLGDENNVFIKIKIR